MAPNDICDLPPNDMRPCLTERLDRPAIEYNYIAKSVMQNKCIKHDYNNIHIHPMKSKAVNRLSAWLH